MDFEKQYSRRPTFSASADAVPDVSVVIPVRNRIASIPAAVDSVLSQRNCRLELILVDDGSTDDTPAYLATLAKHPNVTLITLPRSSGANVARNIGLAHARSDIVAFLDSDDRYLNNRLRGPVDQLRANPDLGLVLSGFKTEKNGTEHVIAPPAGFYRPEQMLTAVARYLLPPGTSGLTVRRSDAMAVGGFDPAVKRMQDRDFVLRMCRLKAGYVIGETLWHKTWSPDGISTPLDTHYESLCELFARHPIYHSEASETRDYLIFRHMLQLLKRSKIRAFMSVKAHARAKYDLRGGLRLLGRYLEVKRERKNANILLSTSRAQQS